MLRSEPNVRCCLCPGNKVTLKNESNFRVCYEIVVLKGAKVNHLKVGVSGPGGNGINGEADIKDAERLPPERGELYPHKPVFVTISGGKIFTVRYKYVGLHTDWAPETRNFSVLDDLVFEQPLVEEIDHIHKVDEEEKRKKEEDEVRLRKEKEAEKRKREAEEKAVQRMCSSTFKHMCSAPDTPKRQCPRCGDWYCNHHFKPNNNPFGTGGHVCK